MKLKDLILAAFPSYFWVGEVLAVMPFLAFVFSDFSLGQLLTLTCSAWSYPALSLMVNTHPEDVVAARFFLVILALAPIMALSVYALAVYTGCIAIVGLLSFSINIMNGHDDGVIGAILK